jgi:beta-lactamase class A
MTTRRTFLTAVGAGLGACAVPAPRANRAPVVPGSAPPPAPPSPAPWAELEARTGGKLGLSVVTAGDVELAAHRADEPFAMASTFKWLLAAAILERVDRGQLALSTKLEFGRDDLLEYAPTCAQFVEQGWLSVAELSQATVTVSDNTAGNLLLAQIGGPEGLTAVLRSWHDPITRLDRTEPSLNTNLPGDLRDTTTPRVMTENLRRVLLGDILTQSSRERLIEWMTASTTGSARFRAGLPTSWRAGDKTGTGQNGACNDVVIAWPPQGPPILAAVYLSGSSSDLTALNAVHAEVGRWVANQPLSPT